MKIDELKNYKTILILGYGLEGRATEIFLKKFVPEARVIIADRSNDPKYLDKQMDCDLVVRSPGIKKSLVKKPYTTATNIFFANVKGKVTGVTGTKGKSTTTTLIYELFKKKYPHVHIAGNIGTPLLTALTQSNREEDIFVVELSSYQLDDIKFSPHIAVITNIFSDHADYHGNFENYFKAKSNIVAFSNETDYLIYNPKCSELAALAKKTRAKTIPFSQKIPFSIDNAALKGQHNEENIKALLAVAKVYGISIDEVKKTVNAFKSLPHRMELVGKYRGIIFYNDAAATTPEATIAAIKTLSPVGTIFLGGQNRGYDFSALARVIVDKKITNLVLFPDTGSLIESKLRKIAPRQNFKILETKDMKKAVAFAYKNTAHGSICLLSGASPSYSIWKNFVEKGTLFIKNVKEQGI